MLWTVYEIVTVKTAKFSDCDGDFWFQEIIFVDMPTNEKQILFPQ